MQGDSQEIKKLGDQLKSDERTIQRICKETGKEFSLKQYNWGGGWFPDTHYCPEVEDRKHSEFIQKEKEQEKQSVAEALNLKYRTECPSIMREFDPNKLHSHNLEKPKNWKYGKMGLLMHGTSGLGKTRCVWRILRKLSKQGIKWEYITTRRLQEDLKFKYGVNKTAILDRITAVAVLALDDLGKEKQEAEWESNIFEIIDRRTNRGLPSIITTNYVGETFSQRFKDLELANALIRRLDEFFIDAPFTIKSDG